MENHKRNDRKSRLTQGKIKHTTFLINNQYSSDTKIIANQLNEYFTNVGNSLAKKY